MRDSHPLPYSASPVREVTRGVYFEYKGWFISDLPKKLRFKLYSQSGRELLGAKVRIYRCADRGYFIGVTNIVMKELAYPEGGICFDPKFQAERGKHGVNTFFITVGEGEGRKSLVLDQLRFNYRYAKGETYLQSFSFTNDYRETKLTDLSCKINNDTAVWKINLSDSDGASMRISPTVSGLKNKDFSPFCPNFLHNVKPDEKESRFFFQARSRDCVPTPIYEFNCNIENIKATFKEIE